MQLRDAWDGEGGPAWLMDFTNLDEELHFLRSLITKWRGAPLIRNLAVKIITDFGCQSRDKKAQAIAIGTWVQDNIYYVHELPERFQTPQETLRLKAGDCDDFTTLIGSMLESIGIQSVMVCMRVNGNWAHIFPAAKMPATNGLLPIDATMRQPVSNLQNPVEYAQQRGKHIVLKLA